MKTKQLAVGLLTVMALAIEGTATAQVEDEARASAEACGNAPLELNTEQRDLLCTALAGGPMDLTVRLARIEQALARIEGPSAANAMLTTGRVQALLGLGRRADALREARAGMRRYPRLAPMWLHAITSFAFSEYTAEAADFWIELTGFNPELARRVGGYHWRGIRERLRARGDGEKVRALARALDAIGYDGGNEASRSALAEELFDEALAAGDTDRARALLPRISNPEKLSQIAVGELTRPFWDDVARVDAQTRAAVLRRWLEGLGEAARDDGELGGRFISAAVAHVGPEPVLAAYAPVLREAMQDGPAKRSDFGFAFWLAPLAVAYVAAGDDAAAEALYRDALAFFTTLDNPVKLNASANLAQFLQNRGRHAEALELIDQSITAMQQIGGVDAALLQMHGVRALALAGLDREPEAWRSLELLRENAASVPDVYLRTLLSLGRYEEARDTLVARLRGPGDAMSAVRFLQPSTAAFRPPRETVPEDLLERLRSDKAVREALQGKGRILEVAPVRLEPFTLPPLKPNPPAPFGLTGLPTGG